MAKSYYKVIDGEKYDRSLLEMAEKMSGKKNEKTIGENDAKKIFEDAKDGRGITEIELKTLKYIPQNFTLSEKAQEYFKKQLAELAGAAFREEDTPQEKEKSNKGFWFWLILILLLILLFFILMRSCNKKPEDVATNDVTISQEEMQKLEAEAKEPSTVAESTVALDEAKAQIEKTVLSFAKGKSQISQASLLNEIAKIMKENPDIKVNVVGHTCKLGSDQVNERVSRGRAQSAVNYLVEQGVASSQLTTTAMANREPLNDGNTEAELSQNRRVTFKVID